MISHRQGHLKCREGVKEHMERKNLLLIGSVGMVSGIVVVIISVWEIEVEL